MNIADELEQAFRQGLTEGSKANQSIKDQRIKQIAERYGFSSQANMLIEESAEYTQAVCKLRRGYSKETYENVKEEVADVIIVAQQLRYLLGADDIDKIIDAKLDRQIERIRKEQNDERFENH